MKIPIEELKEITIEEFGNEMQNKKIHICPFTNKNYFYVYGDIYIYGMKVHIAVKNEHGVNRICIFESGSYLSINISENYIFGIYSYGNNKDYRIAFEGNNPDLLISIYGYDYKRNIIYDIYSIIQKYDYKKYEKNEYVADIIGKLKKIIDEL